MANTNIRFFPNKQSDVAEIGPATRELCALYAGFITEHKEYNQLKSGQESNATSDFTNTGR